jgi:hypothetical protein
VQVHLDIENRRQTGRGFAHVGELGRFVDRDGIGAGKLDQEQVVLNEVVTKGRLGERTICHPVREGMLGVGPPLARRPCLQSIKEAHGLLPDLLNEVDLDWLLDEATSTSCRVLASIE